MIHLAWLFAGIGGAFTAFNFLNAFAPANRWLNRTLNYYFPNAIPDPNQLVGLRYRNLIDLKTYEDLMKQWGYDEEWSKKLYLLGRTILDVSGLLEARRRGLIDDVKFRNELRNRGYDDQTILVLEQLAFMIPSPTDLIRMTVREVFNPAIAERFGQFQEFPSDKEIDRARLVWNELPNVIKRLEEERGRPLLEHEVRDAILNHIKKENPRVQMCVWAILSGVPPEILKMYWGAHWELPSLTAGYEMLHRLRPELVNFKAEDYKKMGLDPERLKFTLDDLKLLLRAQDVMPFWRDKLVAISYHLPTRVDLRRMLRDGIITEEEAHKYYMMLGYTDKDAWNLVKLAKTMYKEENKDLTRSLIMKAYILKEIDRNQAKNMLKEIGYSEEDAEFLLRIQDIENEQQELDYHVDALVRQFIHNVIDEATLSKRLDELGLKASRRDYIIQLARLEKLKRVRLPSISTLKRWYIKGFINKNGVRKYLEGLGYDELAIRNYLKEFDQAKGGGS